MEMIDFNAKKGFLCDMDGVIYHGNRILPGVAEFIHWLQDENKEYLFLTNNSGYTPARAAPEARAHGARRAGGALLHQRAGHGGLPAASRRPAARCTPSARRGCSTRCMTRGITMNDVNPDYVVVGEARGLLARHAHEGDESRARGREAHRRELRHLRPDRTRASPPPAARSSRPIEMATGKQAYFCGKPNPLMMRTGLRMLGCHSGEAVMIGDRMDTDVISGMESGMATVLVLSGVSTRATLDELCLPAERCARRRGGHPAAGAAGVRASPNGDAGSHPRRALPPRAPLRLRCFARDCVIGAHPKPSPQRERLSKRTADRRQKGKTEHRPGRKQSRAVLFLAKENTSFKRERARAVSRRRCRASKSFVCVWGKVVNNR